MSANLEERLRRAMREDAERTPASPVPPPDLRHRVRRRTAFTAGLSVATVVLVAASAVVGVRATGGGPPQPPAGAATCSTWSEVQAPTADPTRFDTYLRSVTAPSPDEALAVGIHRMPGEGGDSFLELQRWDGTAWSTLPAPEPPDYGEGPTLLSVAAAGPGEAWAVGMTNVERGGIPLALHWDGRDWLLSAVDPADEPESHLFGVAAFASDDVWAVGGWARPGQLQGGGLVTHWDGARWWTTALRTTSRPLDEPGGPYDILNAAGGRQRGRLAGGRHRDRAGRRLGGGLVRGAGAPAGRAVDIATPRAALGRVGMDGGPSPRCRLRRPDRGGRDRTGRRLGRGLGVRRTR